MSCSYHCLIFSLSKLNGEQQFHLGSNSFTWGAIVSPGEQQFHLGSNSFTWGTTVSPGEQQFHLGNKFHLGSNSFTWGTTVSPGEQQFHLGSNSFAWGATVSPGEQQFDLCALIQQEQKNKGVAYLVGVGVLLIALPHLLTDHLLRPDDVLQSPRHRDHPVHVVAVHVVHAAWVDVGLEAGKGIIPSVHCCHATTSQ